MATTLNKCSCGKSFSIRQIYNRNRFCSRSCANKKENNPMWIGGTETRKASARKYILKKKYGITPEDYDNLYLSQKGCCKLCGTHSSKLKKILCVDHCHRTGEIRGLLCSKCNRFLGPYEYLLSTCGFEKINEYLKLK